MFLPLRGAEGPVPYWLFCARVAPDGLVAPWRDREGREVEGEPIRAQGGA